MTDFNSIGVVQGLQTSMEHLSKRQRVISENVANSATPRYRARDVARPDFSALLSATQQAADTSDQRGGIKRPTVAKPVVTSRADAMIPHITNSSTEQRANGNDVMVEKEMMKMSEVQGDYAAVSNLYRKARQTIKTAIGRQ